MNDLEKPMADSSGTMHQSKTQVINQNTLPNLIKQCVDLMDTPDEKKMALNASTVLTGALLPHVSFAYDNRLNYTNLYSVIVFPPASGKGKLTVLRGVLDKVEEEQINRNAKLRREFETAKKIYERKLLKGEHADPPEKPQLKLLVVPGNTTSSKLIEQLAENGHDSMSLIYETEADALTRMMNSQNGGDNSMILRNGFHNEPISQMRRTNSEHLLVPKPKPAVDLTCTYSQLPNLFRSTEDGLFSRFLVLMGNASLEWKDVSPCKSCKSIDDQLKGLSARFWDFHEFFKEKKIEVKFTQGQWDAINDFGKRRLKSSMSSLGEYATSIPKRHALMIAKVASVFTAVTYFEHQVECTELLCSDSNFEGAYGMVERSYECSVDLFERLSRVRAGLNGEDGFFEKLPDYFQKKELVPLKETMGVSERTIERWLVKLVETGKLVSPKKGVYRKAMSDLARVA